MRRARKQTKNINFMIPIDITQLGSDDDPCFGKLYSPKASECRRCGDSELCQVVFGQKNHKIRAKEEKKNTFRDIEHESHSIDMIELEKYIYSICTKPLKLGSVCSKTQKKFDSKGLLDKPGIKKVIIDTIKNSEKLKLTKKDEIRFVKRS